ncbi:hypothetical protein [Leptolyngbya sp. FACHB-17]|uniref:hypothetical protein n=1 Tax=unclassified Leptolyngbya TaxID=2650499 RepID=UPI00167FF538|nr:hypothetical protein [Leptolyngbya sp. FACHB-17]MBD2079799.1 hypothetical protein [Leptolyngbya sp. FACHB-17]
MSRIRITIEGKGAIVAAEALVNLPGVSGSWEASDEVKRDGALEVIATIVGLVSGGLSAAEQIRKWYEEYHGSEANKIENVVIITPKERIAIEDATPEQIAKVLKEIAKSNDSRS